jgi:hypothetical protein
VAVKDDKPGDESSLHVFPLVTKGGMPLSDSEKAIALAENPETYFQPVTDPSVPAVIELFDGAVILLNVPSQRTIVNKHQGGQVDIRRQKVKKTPAPNNIPNMVLKNLPQRAVSLLVQILNAITLTHHLPSVCKHAEVINILKLGKDPALP